MSLQTYFLIVTLIWLLFIVWFGTDDIPIWRRAISVVILTLVIWGGAINNLYMTVVLPKPWIPKPHYIMHLEVQP
jgi:hypothetical protein